MRKASELLVEALQLLDEAPAPIAANRVQHAIDTIGDEIEKKELTASVH